jgi:UDP-GlcNAc:undecaprenyl-phosphate GlcNAc-1-phosphate transferase
MANSEVFFPHYLGVFVATLLFCLYARKIAQVLHVLDHPDKVRKQHAVSTPLVGGIAVLVPFVACIFILQIGGWRGDSGLQRVLALCVAGAGLLGFTDDQANITPLARILGLLLLVTIAFALAPQLISPELHFASVGAVPIGYWPYVFFIGFVAVGLVNAVNMADGQNGLVTGMFLIWDICLTFAGGGLVSTTAALLLAPLLVVLIFNLQGRLFLGDCGSYGITFLFGTLAVYAHAHYGLRIEAIVIWFFIPVVDCIRLIMTRLSRGVSPTKGDRDHFHHRLADRLGPRLGLSVYLIAVSSSSLIATFDPRFSLACLTLLASFYFCSAWLTDPMEETLASSSKERLGPYTAIPYIGKSGRRGAAQ